MPFSFARPALPARRVGPSSWTLGWFLSPLHLQGAHRDAGRSTEHQLERLWNNADDRSAVPTGRPPLHPSARQVADAGFKLKGRLRRDLCTFVPDPLVCCESYNHLPPYKGPDCTLCRLVVQTHTVQIATQSSVQL